MANIGVSTGTVTYADPIAGTGLTTGGVNTALNKIGDGTLALTGTNTFVGNVMVTSGTLAIGAGAALGNAANKLVMGDGSTLTFLNSMTLANGINVSGTASFAAPTGTTQTLSGVIGDGASAGTLKAQGPGTLVLSGANTYTGGTIVSSGILKIASSTATLGATTAPLSVSGGTLELNGTAQTAGALTLTSGVIQNGALTSSAFNTQSGSVSAILAGTGALTQSGTGTTILSGANTYTGGTTVAGGVLQLSSGGTLGATTGTLTVTGGALNLGGSTVTAGAFTLSGGTVENGEVAGSITSNGGTLNGLTGATSLTIVSGATLVTGVNTYTGGTTVNGGVLNVTGSLADPTVNSGGTLMGPGSVGATQVNAGGVFAPGDGTPGSSMTINGNLAFQSGATYKVQINPTTTSSASVTGSATLGGASVSAVFANGGYVSKKYTILTATGGVSGVFASSVVNTNLPANFNTSVSYDANNAYLNLTLNFAAPTTPVTTTTPAAPAAPALPNGLNRNQQAVGNALIHFFDTTGGIPIVYGTLSVQQLSQTSGELATASQQTTFDAMDHFMGLMQRSGAETPMVGNVSQRLSVWAAGVDRSQQTKGDNATGSHTATSSVFGGAGGLDYLISPSTVAGVALAQGGTGFGVSEMGSGHSDLFQAGAYLRHTAGSAYLAATFAYGWQDVTGNRTVALSGVDQLRDEFKANAYSGRGEGGYRLASPWIGVTPYGAVQYSAYDMPGYAEATLSGANTFALTYRSKDAADATGELGVRTDKSFALAQGLLTLGSRLAWAYDADPSRTIGASFQALPGAAFTVDGAAQANNSGLASASFEMKWPNSWSITGAFDGAFSGVADDYAGTLVLRRAW